MIGFLTQHYMWLLAGGMTVMSLLGFVLMCVDKLRAVARAGAETDGARARRRSEGRSPCEGKGRNGSPRRSAPRNDRTEKRRGRKNRPLRGRRPRVWPPYGGNGRAARDRSPCEGKGRNGSPRRSAPRNDRTEKRRGRRIRRIPERTLLTVALLLGGPGVLLGMLLLRHKSNAGRHPAFVIGVPLLTIAQGLGLAAAFLFRP